MRPALTALVVFIVLAALTLILHWCAHESSVIEDTAIVLTDSAVSTF